MHLPQLPARLTQIDLLKGLAILAVLALHTLTADQLADSAARFTIGQAVPVFVVLMGLNATASLWRHRQASPRELYTRAYVISRLQRLYLPFLIILAASTVIAAAKGVLTPGGVVSGLLTGTLPYSGPGNYFITFAFQFAIVFPLIFWAYQRRPRTVVVACFALAAAVELAAPHAPGLATYTYSAMLLRFLPFIAVGMLLADRMFHARPVPAWWWAAGAGSVVYLVAVTVDANVIEIAQTGWRQLGQTFLDAFYPLLLVAAGLRFLPRSGWRLLAALGVASYEIFLVQILWFGLFDAQHVVWFPVSVAACCALGWLLHRGLARVPLLTRRMASA
mgnify:CR=1 FL=1